jgi:hypothetical protein
MTARRRELKRKVIFGSKHVMGSSLRGRRLALLSGNDEEEKEEEEEEEDEEEKEEQEERTGWSD